MTSVKVGSLPRLNGKSQVSLQFHIQNFFRSQPLSLLEGDSAIALGKHNMQKIESKHINLRTRIKRLARRTICFSKPIQMHDIVIGLFINHYEFGAAI